MLTVERKVANFDLAGSCEDDGSVPGYLALWSYKNIDGLILFKFSVNTERYKKDVYVLKFAKVINVFSCISYFA